jgi:hypothetical protein
MMNDALQSFCNPNGYTSVLWSDRLHGESQSAIDDHHPTFREEMSLPRDCFLLLFFPESGTT